MLYDIKGHVSFQDHRMKMRLSTKKKFFFYVDHSLLYFGTFFPSTWHVFERAPLITLHKQLSFLHCADLAIFLSRLRRACACQARIVRCRADFIWMTRRNDLARDAFSFQCSFYCFYGFLQPPPFSSFSSLFLFSSMTMWMSARLMYSAGTYLVIGSLRTQLQKK